MEFEPVLLEAPLRAVLRWVVQTLGARVVRNELLIELLATFVVETHRILLLLPNELQRTLVVVALAHVNVLVTRGLRNLGRLHLLLLCLVLRHLHLLQLHLLLGVADAACLHHEHAGLVHKTTTLTRVEADPLVAADTVDSTHSLKFFKAFIWLHTMIFS